MDTRGWERAKEVFHEALEGELSAWYSPDGGLVAAMSPVESRVVVWSAATGEMLIDREFRSQWARPPVFTPDSKSILLRTDTGLRSVPVDPVPMARACRPRELTSSERKRYGIPEKSPTGPSRGRSPDLSPELPLALESPAVEDLRREIAAVLTKPADREDAEARLRIAVRVVGLPDDALVLTLSGLGREKLVAGESEVAESLLRAAYLHGRRTLGPAHAAVEQAGLQLANALNRNGRAGEAEGLLRDLLDLSRRRFGSWGREEPLLSLGRSLLALDRSKEAEAVLREALRISDENHGGSDWPVSNVSISKSLLGDTLLRQERWEEAEASLLGAWESRVPTGAAPEARDAETRERLIRLYEAWGKPEKAEEWRARDGH